MIIRSTLSRARNQFALACGGQCASSTAAAFDAEIGHRYCEEVQNLLSKIFPTPTRNSQFQLDDETYTRRALAAAHLLSTHFGMDDLVWNHISARLPPAASKMVSESEAGSGLGPSFLITRGNSLFDEVSPSSLVRGSVADNVTGDVIHGAIYSSRPDVRAIVHSHTIPITAVSAVKDGLQFLSQDSARFFERLAAHTYGGVSTGEGSGQGQEDEEDERLGIGAAMSTEVAPGAGLPIALLMEQHGATTVGRTVEEAWVRMYYLDVCCRVQLAAGQAAACGGGGVRQIEPDKLRFARAQFDADFADGRFEWPALLQRLVALRASGQPIARQLR